MKRTLVGAALATGVFLSGPVQALDVYNLTVTTSGETITFGLSNIEDVIDQLNPDELRDRYQSADPRIDPVAVTLNFRGAAGVTLAFPDAATSPSDQGTRLLFVVDFNQNGRIDRGEISATIIGEPTRRDALEALFDRLKKDKALLKNLLTGLARYSPVDPLAGNPDSLFGRKMKSDMDQGFKHKVSQVWGCGTSAFNMHDEQPILIAATGGLSDIFAEAQSRAAELQAQNEFGIGVGYTTAKAKTDSGSYNSTSIILPISYTAKLDFNPSHKIRFDFPLGYTDVEGAKAASLGVGLSYTFPVTDVWTLTPAAGYGGTGSIDLLSAGFMQSMSVTSAYTWRLSDWALSMGNSIGQYSTINKKFPGTDVEAGAEISNTTFTNGLILTGPNSLIAKNLVMEYHFTNTQIGGDEVATDQYNEVGISIGRIGMDMGIIDNYIKFGVSYLKATGNFDVDATKINLAARF